MNLLRIELRRFWARKLTRGFLLGVAGVMLVSGIVTFVQHSSDAPTQESIEDTINEELDMCRQYTGDEWRAWDALGGELSYQDGFGEYLAEFESAEAFADEQCRPEYYGGYINDPRYCLVNLWSEDVTYRQGCPDLESAETYRDASYDVVVDGEVMRSQDRGESGAIPSASIGLLALAIVTAASFVGGDYRAGTLETTLLWEPRRWRVLLAKLGAGTLSAFVMHVVLLAFLVLVLLPSGLWRGTAAGVDSAFWQGIAMAIIRGGVAAALLAAMAMSIVFITRHTAGGIAVVLGYSALSPILVNALLRSLRPFDVSENLFAFIGGGEVGKWVPQSGYYESVAAHGPITALLFVAAYAAVAVVVGGLIFRRRDID